MLNHVGTRTIYTKRLILRKFTLDDAQEMHENWARYPEVAQYVNWLAHTNVDQTREVLKDWVDRYKEDSTYKWVIVYKQTNQLIGGIDVVKLFEELSCAEIGYVMSPKFWGKGIMTEALKSIIEYLFSNVGFERIQARYDVDNPASGKVMIKNGMKEEGILRKSSRRNTGELGDFVICSILKDEWEGNKE